MRDKETLAKERVKDYLHLAKEVYFGTFDHYHHEDKESPYTPGVIEIAKMIQKEYHK